MGIYAALGVSQAFFSFLTGVMFALLTYFASRRLHKVLYREAFSEVETKLIFFCFQDAINRIMHAPMSFFDTTV
jgi:hypothetical protein